MKSQTYPHNQNTIPHLLIDSSSFISLDLCGLSIFGCYDSRISTRNGLAKSLMQIKGL